MVDQSGIEGQVRLCAERRFAEAASRQAMPMHRERRPPTISLFTALPEQLGLRLVPVKAPMEVLVIDHIEQPLPN